MTDHPHRWTLAKVQFRDLLGFQGEKCFEFTPGLQVIEAPNHTGKTSLAMGMLWGLTGQIPKLDRLNLKSFRLWNKHAGENAAPSIVISLVAGDGRRMEIRRRYAGRTRDLEGTVELTVGDEELTDAEADARILEELGVKSTSLEGCGVVLQDLRLKLITGTDAEISEVVNDMLGLQALSEVVPMLEEISGEADQVRKEIEAYLKGGNPLQRWQQDEDRLAGQLHDCENEALAEGFEASALEDPEVLVRTELSSLVAEMEAEASAPGVAPRNEVERLRKRLSSLRKSSSHSSELAEMSVLRPRHEEAAKVVRRLAEKWRKHGEDMATEAARGELDAAVLSRLVSECDAKLERTRMHAEESRGEQGLLEVAYKHLLKHPGTKACPLCLAKVAGGVLRDGVKERLDVRLAGELEGLAAEEEQLKTKRRKAQKRLEEVGELAAAHERLVRDGHTQAERLAELGIKAAWPLKAEALFRDASARGALVKAIERGAEEAERKVGELQAREEKLAQVIEQQEENVFQPVEKRINRIRDALVPLLEAVEELEAHGRLRDAAQQRAGDLESVLRDSRDLAGRLKKIASAVSEEESARATAAVQGRLPFVSEFFARVAGNPDFTGLDIQTNVSRNKVTYSLRATSSKMAALGDAVGHVLSEGDMSAAGVALLLGLASGDSHQLGFLLLDDPAQGMDPSLQKNLARELAHLEDRPQVIILTHQPDFAAALTEEGAEKRILGRWAGGRLQDG